MMVCYLGVCGGGVNAALSLLFRIYDKNTIFCVLKAPSHIIQTYITHTYEIHMQKMHM